MNGKLLIVDDEPSVLKALESFFRDRKYAVSCCDNAASAIQFAQSDKPDLALIDLKLGNQDGLELMRELQRRSPDTGFIVMTGYGSIESAVAAVKAGAFHYLTKPFEFPDLLNLVEKALEHRQARQENSRLKQQLQDKYGFENIIGASEGMKRVFDLVRKIADTDSTVLILGESGTGKELVARAIHYNSSRARRAMVPINCGAIPENLLESELFGHVKGAFTGAMMTRVGRFEAADHGSLFLDEIGEMKLHLQVKLLRVLQERRVEPVGSNRSVEVNVRIIAATNRDLETAVTEGQFREDLFYRLNVIPVPIPPLRERYGDVPILLRYFSKKFSEEHQVPPPVFSRACIEALNNYAWPGNVRELENLVERLVILAPGQTIEPESLPSKIIQPKNANVLKDIQIPEGGVSFKSLVSHFENELIRKALEKTSWNKNKAASLLKIKRTTLIEKMKKRQIEKNLSS